jgi:restriction endonuclease Mrr
MPINEIRRHLAARYESRYDVTPSQLEQVVAGVYRDLGYRSRVVGGHSDGGIDIVLDGPNDSCIGVQVKRYRRRISAEQVRAFTGALVLREHTEGIYVTTSDFQPGAHREAERATALGWPVKLIDSRRFFEALKLAQREAYERIDESDAPYTLNTQIRITEEVWPYEE